MKKFVTTSLFIFVAITAGVVVVGLVSGNVGSQSIIGSSVDGTAQVGNVTGVSSIATELVLSPAELTKHNSSSSCWLLINGKIYDVTTYLNQHPGNARTILPTCGTDATVAYATRGGTGTHSSSANADLAAYYIGDLNQTVVTSPTNPTTPVIANPNPTLPPAGNNGEFDD